MTEVIESRCGIRCSKCKLNDEHGGKCAGCANIDNPFWGVCPVKKCCEDKGHANCGMFGDFPCAPLESFAYDKENGEGDGTRIELCRARCMCLGNRHALDNMRNKGVIGRFGITRGF